MITSPYLPGYEYIPDGEPHIFGDRLYVFGSHDAFGGKKFCQNDYVSWSAPLSDLNDWSCAGRIYRTNQDPANEDAAIAMWAPDVTQGPDGRFYLYYCLADQPRIGVAVCTEPDSQYMFLGYVRHEDGTPLGEAEGDVFPFDPAVLFDEDGRIHLYTGQAPRSLSDLKKKAKSRNTVFHMELQNDMLTLATEPNALLPNLAESEGTGYEGHEFFEASSIRKFDGRYYFIYSSVVLHELCWAVSDRPDEGFVYGGVLISNGDLGLRPEAEAQAKRPEQAARNYLGNNHGSVISVNGRYYVFYHRQTGRSFCSRQGGVAAIEMDEKGRFRQAEMTSCGMTDLLPGKGSIEARIACQLFTKKGTCHSGKAQNFLHPAFTQDGPDGTKATQYIENLRNGATAAFKYVESGARFISVTLRGSGKGHMLVRNGEDGPVLADIDLEQGSKGWEGFSAPLAPCEGPMALFFTYEGKGHRDFLEFELYS